jgi:type II secretory ATPase GspE/PulE/Tfp pilus assembly ATPase PilB-like protein
VVAWLEAYKERVNADLYRQAVAAESSQQKGAELLIAQGLNAVEVMSTKASHHRCAFVLVERYECEDRALALFAEDVLRRYRLLPLFIFDERLYIATARPDDLDAFEYLSKLVDLPIEPVVALTSEIDRAVNRIYLTHDKMSQAMETISARAQLEAEPEQAVQEHGDDFGDSSTPAVQMVGRILLQGVNLGASDIHLEPYEKKLILRYRVDGVLREYPAPPMTLQMAIISRIKIAANMDIAERRLPQDGRTTINVDGRAYDMRVSVMPGIHGEAIVIRILSSAAVSSDLRTLGFQTEILEKWNKIIRKPHGIVLVTGPTGSGKSTTLYSTLRSIATPEKKIITLEDPVEYQMDGILQIAVNADIGYTFGVGLRAVLRHDPDIVLIGEIRDLESAEIAIRASLTGHALFSTLHTNSAPMALSRLIDMGVPSYMVTAALNGVLAQRLLRRLCKICKTPASYPRDQLKHLGVNPDATLYRAAGCSECNGIGYRGRVGVHEIFQMTPELRSLVAKTNDLSAIIGLAEEQGFRPLRHSAIHRLESGDTSLEEVIDVTSED